MMFKRVFFSLLDKNNLSILWMSCFFTLLIVSCGGDVGAGEDKGNREKWFEQCKEIREKMDECILNIQDPNDQAAGRACTDEYKNNLDKLHREHGRDPDTEEVEGCPIP